MNMKNLILSEHIDKIKRLFLQGKFFVGHWSDYFYLAIIYNFIISGFFIDFGSPLMLN